MSADLLYLQAPETPAVSRVRPRLRSRSSIILSNTEDTLCAHWPAVKMLLMSLCLLPKLTSDLMRLFDIYKYLHFTILKDVSAHR